MIIGHGSAKPGIIFLGDAPFGKDNESNYALTGYTEKILSELMAGPQLHLGETYRTLLIKESIKLNYSNKGNKKVSELDLAYNEFVPKYESLLAAEINELRPYIIVPLGELSFRWLTKLSGIRKFRGSVLMSDNLLLEKSFKVMPILGPYPYMNQEFRLKFISKLDFNKIPKYLNDNPPPENTNNIWICKDSGALSNFCDRSFPISKYLTFDIETFAGIPTCISFCFDGFESVCVPFIDYNIDRGVRMLMMDTCSKVLASPIPKINQNIKYDWKILERHGFKVTNVVGDTMIGMNCAYPELPKNLGFITSIYTELPYFKDEGKQYNPNGSKNRTQFYLYNAKDSLAVHQTHSKQLQDLEDLGTLDVYNKLIQLLPIYRKMEDTGILIDESERINLQGKYESLLRIEVLKIDHMINRRNFNPRSATQCDNLIFEELGYDKVRGVIGTDEESLELLQTYGVPKRSPIFGPEILQSIINHRKIEKVLTILELSTYPDKRFRCEYNLCGTKNGRTSAGKTTDEMLSFVDNKGRVQIDTITLGFSLQTIGKHGFTINGTPYGSDIRRMFVADLHFSFVEVDRSQAESRVDAILSKDFDILQVFDSDTGIHRLTGSWVFDCSPWEIRKNILVNGIDRYHTSKTIRHAAERNLKANRLAIMTQLPKKECEQILEKLHNKQPNIRGVFHAEIKEKVWGERRLVAPNGRRRDFLDRLDDHTLNEAISFLPQAIVGDDTKFALIPLLNDFPSALPIIEAHDGITSLVLKGKEHKYIETFIGHLNKPIDFRKCSLARDYQLVIPSEASIGERWSEMEEVK